jgi:hypothetical protein
MFFGVASFASGQARRTETPNVECIERLYLPGFGAIARGAQKTGTVVQARIRIGKGGKVERGNIELVSPDPRLSDEVRIMLELSSFESKCAGKMVTLLFTFVREGDPVEHPAPQFSFNPPNRFEVLSAPTLPSIDYAPSRERR